MMKVTSWEAPAAISASTASAPQGSPSGSPEFDSGDLSAIAWGVRMVPLRPMNSRRLAVKPLGVALAEKNAVRPE
ncbi:hypothetical protein D3C87_1751610 [compost metagenome]